MKKLKYFGFFLLIVSLLYLSYYNLSWSELPDDRIEQRSVAVAKESYAEQISVASNTLSQVIRDLNIPSISVAVGVNGQIVWSEAIGYAVLENKIPASIQTSYRIGSTSKAVTSVGLMLLVQQNKLDLDQPVSQLLPDYPPKKWDFSTRQLISHTAGIPDYEDLDLIGGFYSLLNFKQFNSVEEGLSIFKDIPLLYEPGSEFKYNSFDVVLASRIIEKISGEDFRFFIKNRLFQPLNMNHSYADHGIDESHEEAKFYEIDNDGKYRDWHTFGFPHPNQNLSYKWAGGGLLSTPSDLVKLGNMLVSDTTFISTEIRDIFFKPQLLSNGEINEQQYALGWRSYYNYATTHLLGKDTSLWMVHHGGVSKGSMNLLCLFPDQKVVIDVAINGREEDFDFANFWYHVMDLVQPFVGSVYDTNNQ